jgi:hypothetical protein
MPMTEIIVTETELPFVETPRDADRSGANTPGFMQETKQGNAKRRPKPIDTFEEVEM